MGKMKCWKCGDIVAIPICRPCAETEFAPEITRLESELAEAQAKNNRLQKLIDNCRDGEDRKAAIFCDHVKDGVISEEGFEKIGRSKQELRQVYRDLIAAATVAHDLQQPLEQVSRFFR